MQKAFYGFSVDKIPFEYILQKNGLMRIFHRQMMSSIDRRPLKVFFIQITFIQKNYCKFSVHRGSFKGHLFGKHVLKILHRLKRRQETVYNSSFKKRRSNGVPWTEGVLRVLSMERRFSKFPVDKDRLKASQGRKTAQRYSIDKIPIKGPL